MAAFHAVTRPVSLLPAKTREPSGVTITASGVSGADSARTFRIPRTDSSVTVLDDMSPVQMVAPSAVAASMCEPPASVGRSPTIVPSATRTSTTAPAASDVTATRESPPRNWTPWGRGKALNSTVRTTLADGTSSTVIELPPA